MYNIPVPEIQVGVTGIVTPTDPADMYATTHPFYAAGGLKYVEDLTERDAILPSRRIPEITIVWVQADGNFYQLQGGIDNVDWVNLGPSFGGSGPTFYTADGVLTSPRTLGGGGNPLSMGSPGDRLNGYSVYSDVASIHNVSAGTQSSQINQSLTGFALSASDTSTNDTVDIFANTGTNLAGFSYTNAATDMVSITTSASGILLTDEINNSPGAFADDYFSGTWPVDPRSLLDAGIVASHVAGLSITNSPTLVGDVLAYNGSDLTWQPAGGGGGDTIFTGGTFTSQSDLLGNAQTLNMGTAASRLNLLNVNSTGNQTFNAQLAGFAESQLQVSPFGAFFTSTNIATGDQYGIFAVNVSNQAGISYTTGGNTVLMQVGLTGVLLQDDVAFVGASYAADYFLTGWPTDPRRIPDAGVIASNVAGLNITNTPGAVGDVMVYNGTDVTWQAQSGGGGGLTGSGSGLSDDGTTVTLGGPITALTTFDGGASANIIWGSPTPLNSWLIDTPAWQWQTSGGQLSLAGSAITMNTGGAITIESTANTTSLIGTSHTITASSGNGVSYGAGTDWSNITWASDDNAIPSVGLVKANLPSGGIGGTVSANRIPFASALDTLADSPLVLNTTIGALDRTEIIFNDISANQEKEFIITGTGNLANSRLRMETGTNGFGDTYRTELFNNNSMGFYSYYNITDGGNPVDRVGIKLPQSTSTAFEMYNFFSQESVTAQVFATMYGGITNFGHKFAGDGPGPSNVDEDYVFASLQAGRNFVVGGLFGGTGGDASLIVKSQPTASQVNPHIKLTNDYDSVANGVEDGNIWRDTDGAYYLRNNSTNYRLDQDSSKRITYTFKLSGAISTGNIIPLSDGAGNMGIAIPEDAEVEDVSISFPSTTLNVAGAGDVPVLVRELSTTSAGTGTDLASGAGTLIKTVTCSLTTEGPIFHPTFFDTGNTGLTVSQGNILFVAIGTISAVGAINGISVSVTLKVS